MTKQRDSEKSAAPEDPKEWTKLVQTRISQKADDLLNAKVRAAMSSGAAYVRKLIYRDLGILPVDKE